MAADPRAQTVTVVGNTHDGGGLNGSMLFMPGAAAATIVRYNTTTNTGVVLQGRGHIPLTTEPGGAPYCSLTCQRPMSTIDPTLVPGQDVPFENVLAMAFDPAGNLMFGTDRFTGARPMRGITWMIPGAATLP
jgi:hypothetical protein